MSRSAEYYESAGDGLVQQGRIDEARRAYTHAMGDYTQPMDLTAYRRVFGKLAEIDRAAIRREEMRRLGQMKTEKKAAASRENGKKGGRPRKKKDE